DVEKYCDEVEGLSLVEYVPARRTLKKKRGGESDRHARWLAGYQVVGWSENAIAQAVGIRQPPVSRALHRLAKSIGLTMRPGTNNDRHWTPARIRTVLFS